MQEPMSPWTAERLRSLDEAQFQILWFASFGGPPAAVLERSEMERIFLQHVGDRNRQPQPKQRDRKVL
jgi:hypothetical protein